MPDETDWTDEDERAADVAWATIRARRQAQAQQQATTPTEQPAEATEGAGEQA